MNNQSSENVQTGTGSAFFVADSSVSPEYVSPSNTTHDAAYVPTENHLHDDQVPVVTAYPVTDLEEARTSPLRNDFNSAQMPTTTPRIGMENKSDKQEAHPTVANITSTSSVRPQTIIVPSSVIATPTFPLPPPLERHRKCVPICCGSMALVLGVVFCICCIVPLIIVIAAVRQSRMHMSEWDDNFA